MKEEWGKKREEEGRSHYHRCRDIQEKSEQKERKENDKEVFLFFFSVGLDRKTSGTSLVLHFALQLKYIGQEKFTFIFQTNGEEENKKRQHRSVHSLSLQ